MPFNVSQDKGYYINSTHKSALGPSRIITANFLFYHEFQMNA
jgi:hypothetical protein